MAKITTDEVKRLAELAMLLLETDEIESLVIDLKNIFEMIDEINSFDTNGVEQTSQVTGLKHVTRDDTIKDYGVNPEELLKASPKTKNDSIEVPSVQ